MKNHEIERDDEEDYISRLNRTLVDLKNAILEKDRILKAEGFEMREPQLNSEIENLKKQKRECNEIIRRLRVELSESEKREDKLREKNMEACATLEELTRHKLAVEARLATRIRREQSEADRTVAELTELRRQNLESRRALEEVTRKLSEADCSVEELKKQNLVACNAARLYREKFESLNVKIDELVNVKNDSVVVDDVDDGDFIANINTYVNLSETGIGLERFDSGDSSNRTINKRKITVDCSEDSVVTKKGKKGSVLCYENDESHVINRRVIHFRNLVEKKWMCGAYMLKAFDEDDELCMDAVCALHRKQVSTPGSNLVQSHFQTMRGCDLAEYLIDGDPKLRRKKSVSEVKNRFPDVVNRCRILAADYYEKLFMMYCNGEDPFFGPI
ncbi:hypothetical protein ACP275_01G071300 [Erythranthe tilingii]